MQTHFYADRALNSHKSVSFKHLESVFDTTVHKFTTSLRFYFLHEEINLTSLSLSSDDVIEHSTIISY